MRDALDLAKLIVVDRPLDPVLEVTRYIGEWNRRFGHDPIFRFDAVRGSAGIPLVMNLLTRETLLRSLGVGDLPSPLRALGERLEAPGVVVERGSDATRDIAGLGELPLLHHQPRDAGKYLTSFIGSLTDPDGGRHNLGFYRAQVAGERELILFADARTDAHRIITAGLARRDSVPITLFNGGPLSLYLAAAAKIPPGLDSFEAAARLQGSPIHIDCGDYPPAPADAEIVLHGQITREIRDEGPFGEFKGYYSGTTRSPVVRIDAIRSRDDPYCLGLFCGKESGLTLMALQNEMLLFAHLRALGFAVRSVRYPLAAFGEYAAVIEADAPTPDMLEAAMAFDGRAKLVVVAHDATHIAKELAIFPTDSRHRPYIRHGRAEGQQIGLISARTLGYHWTEY